MQKRIFLLTFGIFSTILYFLSDLYREIKIEEYSYKKYNTFTKSLETELGMMIKEKQNITLSIAISLSHGHNLSTLLMDNDADNNNSKAFLNNLTAKIRETTDFKNVWIQLVDKSGVSIGRNWSSKSGDNLLEFRPDVATMIESPRVHSSISVGLYNLSFKAMVPLYDRQNDFLGFIEIITHFDSIAKQIKHKGYEPLVVVAQEYASQIKTPFTNTFVSNHYIANSNADKESLELLRSKGIEGLVSYDKNYRVCSDFLIFNHPIVTEHKNSLANFLVFIPLEAIDIASLKTIHTNITLLSLFAFILGGFLFYTLYSNLKTNVQVTTKSYIWFFVFLFLSSSGVYFIVLSLYLENQKNDFLVLHNKNISRDFEIINNKFSQFANNIYMLTINKPEIVTTLAQAYLTEDKKAQARKRLYLHLQNEYAYLQEYGIKQLHFHLKDNESFLRFHRPLTYGDNLTGMRPTIEHVNKNLTPISGFEEGRVFNGFRHAYPLFSQDENALYLHQGSVEISFGADAVLEDFIHFYGAKAGFLMSQKEIEKYLFADEKANYMPSLFTTFMYEVSIKEKLIQRLSHIEIAKLDTKDIKYVEKQIYKGEVFSVIANDNNSIFTFIPLKNPISKKVVGTIILQENTNEIRSYWNQFYILLLFGITALFFALLYLYKEFSSKKSFEILLQKTQNILDSQDMIVVVTDGKSIINANKKFFDFFGLLDLETFQKEHTCICDYFLQEKNFFHVGDVKEGASWVESIMSLTSKNRIVSMQNKYHKKYSFAVLVSEFDEDYIISFSDISEQLDEHFSLELKVTHDTLTNAYSREYFHATSLRFIEESVRNGLYLGLIIFDIDHFKSVNDTYGHNRGDTILQELVKVVQASIRSEDILVRWGGEEFILLAKSKSLEDIAKMAEFIRVQIEQKDFEDVQRVTCSFGVTLYDGMEDIHETIARADSALYEAKKSGRNCIVAK